MLGEVAFCVGDLSEAKTYNEDAMALYDPQQRRAQILVYEEDPAIGGRYWRGTSLFLMGYPDRALQGFREISTLLASKLTHANSLAIASLGLAWVHTCRREPTEARGHAETALVFATEHGMPFWLAWGTIIRGWTLSAQGDGEGGIAELRQGLAIYHATGATELHTFWLALLAEAYLKNGQTEEGLATVSEALAFADRTDERFYEAELYRLKGELLLQQARQQGTGSREKRRRGASQKPVLSVVQGAKGKNRNRSPTPNPSHPAPSQLHAQTPG